jgi:vacuolar-type H+-ATPase subunit B/Vma2
MHGGSTLRRRVALAVFRFARHPHQSIRRERRRQAHVHCFRDRSPRASSRSLAHSEFNVNIGRSLDQCPP